MERIFGILTPEQARQIEYEFGTPTFIYSQELLEKQATKALQFPNEYGLTVRYAMKALSTKSILQLFDSWGLHLDASSGYEVERALRAGIRPDKIQLTAQELPRNLGQFIDVGVRLNACSLSQLEKIGQLPQKKPISLRINPGKGSGSNGKVNVGGSSSSFGIWHESIPEAQWLVQRYGLCITRLHTHIGSGSDPSVWQEVAHSSLRWVEEFPDVEVLNLGGGFKVARVAAEKTMDLQLCGDPIKGSFLEFYKKTGRKLHLEIEPGTFLVANAGAVITTIQDIVATDKYTFLKVNSGMTEVTRPALYAAQHPIAIISSRAIENDLGNDIYSAELKEYVVVGHCCESGDLWTPARGNAEQIQLRQLSTAHVGDLLVMGGAGAYCSSMSMKNYNSFPEAAEVLVTPDDQFKLIRRRQTLEQMVQNES